MSINDLIRKLKLEWRRFLRRLFGKSKRPQVDVSPTPTPSPSVPYQPSSPITDGKPPGHYVGWSDPVGHPMNNWEPPSTSTLGTVESFLWKPVSDNTGKPVVVVSCDDVPRDELDIVIKDRNDKLVPFTILRKSRGNPIHRYGRVNFYLGQDATYFVQYAPLKVYFRQESEGISQYIKIQYRGNMERLEFETVTSPKRRKDLK